MSKGDVIRGSDGRRYLLGEFVKAGLIGAVYPGVSMDDARVRVAVKLPLSNLSPEGQQRFRQEFSVMSRIAERFRERNLPLYIPWCQEGQNETRQGEALILEWIGENLLLANQLPSAESAAFDREVMALAAAEQYAEVLRALHSQNYTCPDRKAADIRWHNDRLVVLDWNVVSEWGNASNPDYKQAVLDDIFLFGSLWYQFLTGRYPPVDPDPLEDDLWGNGTVSYGTRKILASTLASAPGRRPKDAHALVEELRAVRAQFREDPEILYSQGRIDWIALRNQAKQAALVLDQSRRTNPSERSVPLPDFTAEWKALELLDIAWRKGRLEAAPERQGCLALVKDQGIRLVGNIEHAFRLTVYDTGLQAAEQATQVAREPGLALMVARWALLIQAGRQAMRESLGLRPIRDELAQWLLRVQSGSDATSIDEWDRWSRAFEPTVLPAQLPPDSETFKLLLNLRREVSLRKALAQLRHAEARGHYLDALKSCDDCVAQLQEVSDGGLQLALGATLPDFARWRRSLVSKAEAYEVAEDWKRETSPDRVLGRPHYIDFLLRQRLPDVQRVLSSSDQAELALAHKALTALASLYRLRDRASDDPLSWADIGERAWTLYRDADIAQPIRLEALAYCQEARRVADRYAAIGDFKSDQIAVAIYEALRRVSMASQQGAGNIQGDR